MWSVGSVPKWARPRFSGWYLGWVSGSLLLSLLLPVGISRFGPILLACWSSGLLFFALCTGLRVMLVLGLVVFLLWSCSFCMSYGLVRGWIWRKLFPGTVGQVAQFQCRLFLLVQALIFGDLAGIGALFRALVALPGGIRRFVPCDVGANHCRPRHIEWERCRHGLTSRPPESASEGFLNELLVLFCYPCGSAAALLNGVLPLCM